MSINSENIVLRDLQTLLSQSISNKVIVVEYKSASLLPKGENYGSAMLKVESVIRRSKSSPEETLHLVAKMRATTELQRSILNSSVVFVKEMFVFEALVPAFRQLEKELGVDDEHLFDILPKYYGGRLSIDRQGDPNVADEDAVVLMENLNELGYYIMNRKRGLDWDHAKLAVGQLARFHALSMAINQKKPAFFEKAKKPLNANIYNTTGNKFEDMSDHILRTICKDPRIAEYEERVRACVEANKDWHVIMKAALIEPWVSICHGDFWVNNMLFRQENGRVKDVKFIDFQMTRMNSPTKDLPYFLCTSIDRDVTNNCFDQLLDIYYNKLIECLTMSKCDVSPYTRQSFNEQLKADAKSELLRCLVATKFFTQDATDDLDLNDMVNSIVMTKASDLYLERSWMIVSKFVEKRWI